MQPRRQNPDRASRPQPAAQPAQPATHTTPDKGNNDAADPMLDMRQVDKETHHILPEEAWYGAEFEKREPKHDVPPEDPVPGEPSQTSAFTMQEPDFTRTRSRRLQRRVAATTVMPYAANSSRLDKCLTKERRLQDTAALKAKQLIRNGLVTHNTLTPILTLPNGLSENQQNRRRAAAAAQVKRYGYESSGDEVEDYWEDRQSEPKVKFANLKQALAKHELPPKAPKVAKSGAGLKRKASETLSASNGGEQQAYKRSRLGNQPSAAQRVTWVTMAGDDLRRSIDFQKAMRDPGHPDFGFSFSAAVEFALAKEKEAISLAGTLEHWPVDGDDAETAVEEEAAVEHAAAGNALEKEQETAVENAAETSLGADNETVVGTAARRSGRQTAKPTNLPGSASAQKSIPSGGQVPKERLKLKLRKSTSQGSPMKTSLQPQQPVTAALPTVVAHQPLRIGRITVPPKYDPASFEAAAIMQELGLNFGDLRVVELYNRQLQEEVPSRPYRSQNSLLTVLTMTKEDYFGV
jgi:hypothetical protein